MKKIFILSVLFCVSEVFALTISTYDVDQAINAFPAYVKTVKKQAEWFNSGTSFIVKKAAKVLGYDKYTLELIPSINYYFTLFGYDQQQLVSFLKDHRDELVSYANTIFVQVGSGKMDANRFVRLEHAAHVSRLGLASSQDVYRATAEPIYFLQLIKNGSIDRNTFFFTMTLNLFTEYIAQKYGVVKKVVPKWLRWLF